MPLGPVRPYVRICTFRKGTQSGRRSVSQGHRPEGRLTLGYRLLVVGGRPPPHPPLPAAKWEYGQIAHIILMDFGENVRNRLKVSSLRFWAHFRLPLPSTASGWPSVGGGSGPEPQSQKRDRKCTLSPTFLRYLLAWIGVRYIVHQATQGLEVRTLPGTTPTPPSSSRVNPAAIWLAYGVLAGKVGTSRYLGCPS